MLSKDEAKFVFEKGCEQLILGSGQMGNVHLSPEGVCGLPRTAPETPEFPVWHLASFAAVHKIATRSEVCGHRPTPGPDRLRGL